MGTAGPSPPQGLRAGHARGWSLGAPGGCGGAAHPREPAARDPAKQVSSRRWSPGGPREQPPDAPRRLEGEGRAWGVRGARRAAAPQPRPCAGEGTAETAGAARWPFSTGAGRVRGGGRHSRSPSEAGSAGGRRLLGHRLPDAREAAPRAAAAAAPPQSSGEMNSPSSGRGQGEPRTPALALPEAAKLWARPRRLAASSRFASGTGQVAGVWGGGSGQLPSSHWGASEWGPGDGGDGSWAPPPPAPPPLPPLLGAVLWPPLSASGTCPPSSPRSSGAGCGSPPDFSRWFQLGALDSTLM